MVSSHFQFILCTCFISFENKKNLSPNRVRLLSEMRETEDDTSEFEPFPMVNKNGISSNLLMTWDVYDPVVVGKPNGVPNKQQNGYGTIMKSIEVL